MPRTRGELKALVKELIVEVLSEGLGNVQASASRLVPHAQAQGSVRENRTRTNGGRRQPGFDPRLDTPLPGGRQATAELKDRIKANAGGNPIMESILADTAVTTLPKLVSDRSLGQTAVELAGGAGQARGIPQVEQINGTPEQVFGEETASRWADLAFMATKKTA